MADRTKSSDHGATPPPLLLMPPGEGLTLDTTISSNILMPVAPTGAASLMSEAEEVDVDLEADSFVGQNPSPPPHGAINNQHTGGGGTYSFFQSSTPATSSDPFSQVGANPIPSQPQQVSSIRQPPVSVFSPVSQIQPPHVPANTSFGPPPVSIAGLPPRPPVTGPPFGGLPPRGGTTINYHRAQGPLRYAQPPPGTYASAAGSQHPGPPPPAFDGVPIAQVAPMQPEPMPNDASGMTYIPMSSTPQMPNQGVALYPNQKLFQPVQPHWFFCKIIEHRAVWLPMSLLDTMRLEEAYNSPMFNETSEPVIVFTDGGRYDVDLRNRCRTSVYWEEAPTEIKRCTWFYKSEGDNRYIPYDEEFAGQLEEEYKTAVLTNVWHKRLEFPGGETIVMHNPNVIVHFRPSSLPDEWGTVQGDQMRPRVVKRGIEEFENIEDGEPALIDHLVFVVHGIGQICDIRFRGLVECVDDLRSNSNMLLSTHFQQHVKDNRINRIEYLPVHWHQSLHGDATGIDRRLKQITLKSIPKLRDFTNDTLLDILFYTSPKYCQTILDTVTSEINRLYDQFLQRNPSFTGQMSIAGHSLGSAVMFDLLVHQPDAQSAETSQVSDQPNETEVLKETVAQEDETLDVPADLEEEGTPTMDEILEKLGMMNFKQTFENEHLDLEALTLCSADDIKELGLPMGPRKKLLGYLKELRQKEEKRIEAVKRKAEQDAAKKLMEEKLLEQQKQSEESKSATSIRDPLISQDSVASITGIDYVDIGSAGTGQPHVRYPKLNFTPVNFFALGSPIALFLTTRGTETIPDDFSFPTCTGFFNIFHPFDPVAYRIEPLIAYEFSNIKPVLMPHHKGRKRLHLELRESLAKVGADLKERLVNSWKSAWNTVNEFARAHRATPQSQNLDQDVDDLVKQVEHMTHVEDSAETGSVCESVTTEEDLVIGQLNGGRRIDYVLQEKPIESFNDYLFALASHGCYWESEDTALLILKETYALMGVTPQKQGPPAQKGLRMTSPPRESMPPLPGQPPVSSQNGFMSAPYVGNTASMPPPPMGPPTGTTAPLRGLPPPLVNVAAGHPPMMAGPPPLSGFVRKS
ncbi:triacylglycerol hydrolase DDHD2-like isoform X2 [Tubulanus polymorphus]|uniref:triacylglycerol hydrolase DDHD2-like isoform X2 n=1 Tax=Tubulanus polymorphus TaxID=672921 RepID=UPI003DA44996